MEVVKERPNMSPRDIFISEDKLFNKIGVLDPDRKNINPFTGEKYTAAFLSGINSAHKWRNVPMYKNSLNDAINTLYKNQVILIVGGTGSGKTLLSPYMAMHTLNYKGKIAITNPKILPSKKNAETAQAVTGCIIGREIGIKYHNSEKELYNRNKAKFIYLTDGSLMEMCKKDENLTDFDMVMIDEAHERTWRIDMLLVMLKRAMLRRNDLKLGIISATIDQDQIFNYFPPHIYRYGMFDAKAESNMGVDEYFINKSFMNIRAEDTLVAENNRKEELKFTYKAALQVVKLLVLRQNDENEGDFLVFLTGSNELKNGCDILSRILTKVSERLNNKVFCSNLKSKVPKLEENYITEEDMFKNNTKVARVFNKGTGLGKYEKKVVFSTDVAESSITIRGLKYVIDTGLAKQDSYDVRWNRYNLDKKPVSRASHKQRRGRVGRLSRGECYNLFSWEEYKNFPEFIKPKILTVNFIEPLLAILGMPEVTHIDLPIKLNRDKKSVNMKETLSVNEYIEELLDIPEDIVVQYSIKRLYYLDIIYINSSGTYGFYSKYGKNIVEQLGTSSEFKIELNRSILAAHNYDCVIEVMGIVAICEVLSKGSQINVGDLFTVEVIKYQKITDNEYENGILKKFMEDWDLKYGDLYVLGQIWREFYIREVDQVNVVNDNVYQYNKFGSTTEWCKNKNLNYNKLQECKVKYQELEKNLLKLIADEKVIKKKQLIDDGIIDYKTELSDRDVWFLYEKKPRLYVQKEHNILAALYEGWFLNTIVKIPNGAYRTIFPEMNKGVSINKMSILAGKPNIAKFCIYLKYQRMGTEEYFLITEIPKEIIEDIITRDKKKNNILAKINII